MGAAPDLWDLAAAGLGGDILDLGAFPDAGDWRGRVFWCPRGGVLKGADAAFGEAVEPFWAVVWVGG